MFYFKTRRNFILLNSEIQIGMNIKLSQKQIGQRITELLKMKGLSQEDLTKSVKISRPSLTQIELGNRSVDIFELQRLSFVLEFSLDDFMSNDFLVSREVDVKEEKKSTLLNCIIKMTRKMKTKKE